MPQIRPQLHPSQRGLGPGDADRKLQVSAVSACCEMAACALHWTYDSSTMLSQINCGVEIAEISTRDRASTGSTHAAPALRVSEVLRPAVGEGARNDTAKSVFTLKRAWTMAAQPDIFKII